MNRRQFLIGSMVAAMAGAGCRAAPRRSASAAQPSSAIGLTLGERDGVHVPADYIGLSYETSSLADPTLFSADNSQLVSLFRTLSLHGVLRIGGNSSDFADWSQNGSSADIPAPRYAVPPNARVLRYRRALITGEAIRNLAGFLDATGWRLIYGLNLGTGDPVNQADQAAYVASQTKGRLLALQIGNEPDLFHHNGLRDPSWGYTDYYAEWRQFADAVRLRLADPPLAGPDVAGNTRWIESFAETANRDGAVLLSGHYYAEGPPSNPAMTIDRLLRGDPRVARRESAILAASRSCRTPFRMTEGNTCYDGGKEGVSNTFASALWAADYILQTARAGYAGINFHGGGYGLYTPIAGKPGSGFSARPIYYGMLAASRFAGSRMTPVAFDPGPVNMTAYGAATQDRLLVAVINKDESQSAPVNVAVPRQYTGVTVSQLSGPSPNATAGATFAGEEVLPGMTEAPKSGKLDEVYGRYSIVVPPASAVVLAFR